MDNLPEIIPAGTKVRFVNKDAVDRRWRPYLGCVLTVSRTGTGYVVVEERLNDDDNGNWPRDALEIDSYPIDSSAYDEAMTAMEIYDDLQGR